jgi:hypothetical protein
MKAKGRNEVREDADYRSAFGRLGANSCRGILAQIGRAKDAIFAEARGALKVHDHLLRLALNEAEALAWQTLYPHLVFPSLAAEKVQSVAAWNNHQQTLNGQVRPWRF